MTRRGTLLKDLQPADLVMALDAYREDTGREPTADLAGVPVAYLKRASRDQERTLASYVPSAVLLVPAATMTPQQLVAASRQGKVYPLPDGDQWRKMLAMMAEGHRPLVYDRAKGKAYWPVRAFEAALLEYVLGRTVTDPGKYVVKLGAPPEAFRRPPQEEGS
jgi:hypothetical protein